MEPGGFGVRMMFRVPSHLARDPTVSYTKMLSYEVATVDFRIISKILHNTTKFPIYQSKGA